MSLSVPAGLLLALLACGAGAAPDRPDPLAAELERSSAFLQSKAAGGGSWAQVQKTNQPVLARAGEDLRAGRRQLALQRLANVRAQIAMAGYLNERPAGERQDLAGFEAEWTRMGGVLRADLQAPSPAAFDGVPAAARALGEAAVAQIRGYYEASLEYGRATMPDQGLYYLANAQAQRELAAFCRTLAAPSDRQKTPALRSLRSELDALEAEMLAVYRPPVSIERHSELIVASATLKEARELDAAGLRYGALLRYLQAAQQFAPLRPDPPLLHGAELDRRLDELQARLAAGGTDHSLGQLLLDSARAEAARVTPGSTSVIAAILAADVLPRYFAALEPARPQAPKPAPQVTVTLVRWPYT